MPITRNGQMLANLKRGTSQIASVFRGTTQIWAHEIVVVLGASGAQTYMADLFDPTVWASTTPKRVVVPEGVERGASGSWVLAVVNGVQAASFGGTLTLEVRGTLSGRGGAANSGVGGDVVWANVPGKDGQQMVVNNYGTMRAGGGGGGKAGNGGAGTYNSNVTEGPTAVGSSNSWTYAFRDQDHNEDGWRGTWAIWAGVSHSSPVSTSTIVSGIYTFTRGAYVSYVTIGSSDFRHYKISRSYVQAVATNGGLAGNGGRGQGYDDAATTGAAAVAGGTNAGASGKSGDGAAYGATGQTGANGANGNAGSGLAGLVGGLAGFYLNGTANAVLNNYGTVLGRLN